MRRATLAFLIFAICVSPAFADILCAELWAERNAVYKDAGYCFKTERAIRAFGNAGCSFDDIRDVPLSPRDRGKVEEIQQDERRNRCPR